MAVLKKEFIDRMSEKGGITKKAARLGIDLFLETLMDCMSEGDKVMLSGFGRFEMKTMREKKGRNLRTGESCTIPEHRKMRFFASDLLADKIEELRKDD